MKAKKNDYGQKKTNLARKLLIRGLISIIASGLVVLLIRTEIAEPYPNLKFAYIASAAVAIWGLIDLIRSLFEFRNSK